MGWANAHPFYCLLSIAVVLYYNPQQLWRRVKVEAGVTYDKFQAYYEKSQLGVAIQMELIQTPRKISLDKIREKWEDFRPPQSFQYLTLEQILLAEEILSWPLPSQSLLPQLSFALS